MNNGNVKTLWLGVGLCAVLSVGIGPARTQAELGQGGIPPGIASVGNEGHMILAGLELTLPMFIEAFDKRLSRYMEAVGESSLTRVYTDKEMYLVLINNVQRQHPGALQDPIVRIRSDGFHGSIKLNFGGISAKIQGKVALKLVDGRLHVRLQELNVNGLPVSSDLLNVMEHEVNQMIDSQELTLKILEFSTREGSVLISVEVRGR